MRNYKNLLVWLKAHALVLNVYKETAGFPKSEQFILISQLRRSATSIPTDVAQGCGKYSQSEFANYLQIALGSSNEVDYLVLLSHDLRYLQDDIYKKLDTQVNDVKAMLISLIMKVRKASS